MAAALAACGGPDSPPAPAPPTSDAAAVTTTVTTPAEAVVPTVPGAPRSTTTVPLSLGPGEASLAGTVTGPAGGVSGAVVRVERLVGTRPAATDLRADESGAWSLDSILGGPYRVTAFRAPDLGALEPQLFFLGSTERRSVPIALASFGEGTITATIEPNPPRVGVTATFVVRVGTGRVDGSGAVVIDPQPATRLQLVSEGLAIDAPAQLTDGEGRVSWQVRCLGTGTFPVTLLVGNGLSTGTGASVVPFPACGEGPPAAATSEDAG